LNQSEDDFWKRKAIAIIGMISCPMPSRPEIGFAARLFNSRRTKNGVPTVNNTRKVIRAQLRPFPIMYIKSHIVPRLKNVTSIMKAGGASCAYIDTSMMLRKTPNPNVM